MATSLAVGDKLRVVMGSYSLFNKQLGESAIYYRVVATTLSMEEWADALRVRFAIPMATFFSNGVQFQGVSVQRVAGGPRTTPYYSLGNTTGLQTGAVTMPTQVAGLLRYRTQGIAGDPPIPPSHGRTYIPFPASVWGGTDGSITTTGFSALEAIRVKLGPDLSIASGEQLKQVIFQRGPNRYLDVTASETVPAWATQRRRSAFGQLNRPFGT